MAPSKNCRVILFAKAPVPGAVKTRLIPVLGAAAAAQLHERLVLHALSMLIEADVGPVEICCAPDDTHPFFQQCQERFKVQLTVQSDGDLGRRMHEAFLRALTSAPRALIVGADCPSITVADVRDAAARLADNDASLIPADDGGYVLIGARRSDPRMFNAIDWGTSSVLAEQRACFQALQWRWAEGETRWDVDRPEDLARLAELRPQIAFEQV